MTGYESKKAAARDKLAQPEQEKEPETFEAWANSVWEARATHGIGENTVPLYITPPQRPGALDFKKVKSK